MTLDELPEWLRDVHASLPPLLTVEQAAVALHMHHKTVRKCIARGELRAVRSVTGAGSSRVIIPRVSVLDWLREHSAP